MTYMSKLGIGGKDLVLFLNNFDRQYKSKLNNSKWAIRQHASSSIYHDEFFIDQSFEKGRGFRQPKNYEWLRVRKPRIESYYIRAT
jgi:hypothetical protein